MRKLSSGTGGHDDDNSSYIPCNVISLFLSEDLSVCEILSRLPVKSLMRFKCVCKRWRSLIQQDPHLIHLHGSRSKTRHGATTLLIISYVNNQIHFSLANDLFEGGQVLLRLATPGHQVIHNPLNGLTCLVLHSESCVRISNISTGENTPWINLTLKEGEVEEGGDKRNPVGSKKMCKARYGFGFDPTTMKHKLICIWEISREILNLPDSVVTEDIDEFCEVLTVGQNTWRRIDDVPQYKVGRHGVYMNGSIYWKSRGYNCSARWKRNNPESFKLLPHPDAGEAIVAFDLGSEKFRVISIPNHTFHQPQADGENFWERYRSLIVLDGRIAITDVLNPHTVKLWIFDGHDHDKSTGTSTGDNWIEETIAMPFTDGGMQFLIEPIAGTDQIIITPRNKSLRSLYYYDRKNRTFREVTMTGEGTENLPLYGYAITTFTESLLPVH